MNTIPALALRAVTLVAVLITPLSSFAATEPAPANPAFTYPTYTVQGLRLDASTYASGDVVTGSFLMLNTGKQTVSNAGYVVRIVGDFKQGNIWNVEYARQTVKDIALNPGQSRTVPISIELPAGLTGDLGVEVQAQLNSGTFLGWSNARIKVTGTNTFAKVTNSYVKVGNLEFDIGNGPTVHEGETAELFATLSNETDAALTLMPSIALSKQGKDMGTRKGDTVTVSAHGTVDIHMPINGKDPAGVYIADVTFVDAQGKTHAPILSYRYIIDGDTATIQSVTADKTHADKRETVSVTVLFTGNPPDINPTKGSSLSSQASTTVSVVLFSERGTRVGGSSKVVDLATERSATFAVPITAPSNAFRADVTMYRDGKVLAHLDTPLSQQYGYFSVRAQIVSYVLYALIALFAIIAAVLFVRARRAEVPNPKERIAVIVCIVLAVLGAVLAVLIYMGVFALMGFPKNTTPVAHAESYGDYCGYYAAQGMCTPECGCDPAAGDPGVYVNPDVCPIDDGVQTEGPCEHVMMNLTYVDDASLWDYYMRNYLPYWEKYQQYYFAKTISPQADLPIVSFGELWSGLLWQSTTSYDGTPYNQYLTASASDPQRIYANTAGLGGGSRPNVYIQPVVGPIRPGGQFTVDGSVSYQECTNTPIDMVINTLFQGEEYTSSFPSTISGQPHTVQASQNRFSFGPFDAPEEAGTYRLYFNMGWKYRHFHPGYEIPFGSSNVGHIDIVVTAVNDLIPGTLAPTTAVLDQPTTVSIPINNQGNDNAAASITRFSIVGPDVHYETVHVPESQNCYYSKEGEVCDVIPGYDYQEELGFHDTKDVSTAAVPGNSSKTASFQYTFDMLGTYQFNICADQAGTVSETNENNNCTTGTIVVSPAVPTASCTVSNQNPLAGESVTYTATPANGATGPYTWHASDGATGLGSASTATRSFSVSGSYGMGVLATGATADGVCPTVTVTGGSCSNPSGTLTATPNRVRPNVATSVTFNYGATGANSCTLSGPGITTQNYTATACTVTPGTYTTNLTIATQGVYTLTCDGSTTRAIVNVIPAFDEF